jgi:hypothetical protein
MSMSWEHVCVKCGKEFSNFSPRDNYCFDCDKLAMIKDLPDNHVLRITDFGGGKYACIEAKYVKGLSSNLDGCNISLLDVEYNLPLERDEMNLLENRLGHKLIFIE